MQPTWIALFLALQFSGVAFGAGASGSLPTVPPDNSLTSKEYSDIGLPPLDIAWTSARYERAIGVLKKLTNEDLTKLPRHRSQKSGDVFEKLEVIKARRKAHTHDSSIRQSYSAMCLFPMRLMLDFGVAHALLRAASPLLATPVGWRSMCPS